MIPSIFQFLVGMLIALFLPRLPLVILPRFQVMEGGLTPFPLAQPIDKYLISQLLLLRTIWKVSFLFALIPLAFGYLILTSFASALAFGLFIGAGWSILSRLIPAQGSFPNTPYPTELIHQLNQFRVEGAKCCSNPELAWEVTSIRCQSCGLIHLARPRPDLGRRRTDGWLGKLRLLFLDGHPLLSSSPED